MISVQIAISKLTRAGLTAYLSERRDPRLIVKYKALDILSYRSLVVLDGFISGRALNSVLDSHSDHVDEQHTQVTSKKLPLSQRKVRSIAICGF